MGTVTTTRPGAEARVLALTSLAISLAFTTVLGLRTASIAKDPCFVRPWDHHKYLHMAQAPLGTFHVAPFCWRVGVPLLAKLLPLCAHVAFAALSFVTVWLTGALFFAIGRRRGSSNELGLVVMLLYFTLSYGAKTGLRWSYSPDAAVLLVVVLGLYLLLTRRDLLFAAVLALGVLFKESALFIAPLHYSLRARRLLDLRALAAAAAAAAPALLMLVAVRLLIPALNHDPTYVSGLPPELSLVHRGQTSYGYLAVLHDIGLPRLRSIGLDSLIAFTLRPFGASLLLLAGVGLVRWPALALRLGPLVALSYLQLLFATDTERLLVLAAPALIFLATTGVQSVSRSLYLSPVSFAPPLLGLFAALLLEPHTVAVPGWWHLLPLIIFGGFLLLRRVVPPGLVRIIGPADSGGYTPR